MGGGGGGRGVGEERVAPSTGCSTGEERGQTGLTGTGGKLL